MTTDFYNLLLTDCALAAVLLALFLYVGRVSRGVRGIATWGVAHFLYSLGAAMLDGTAQELARAGDDSLAHWTAGLGGLLACAGLVGLAWSIIQFVQQRALSRWERALLPVCIAFSLVGWVLRGTVDAQGAAMSATEVIVLVVMIGHLLVLRRAPDHVPARLMIGGCLVLLWLYGSDLLAALTGTYGPNPIWVNLDLSIWYLLNFCMLMLASFRAAEPLRRGALFDPLTGALNRRGLDNELQSQGAWRAAEHGLRWSPSLANTDIHVSVHDGEVTLTGRVGWEFQRLAAEAAVRHIIGVSGIDNALQVSHRQPARKAAGQARKKYIRMTSFADLCGKVGRSRPN